MRVEFSDASPNAVELGTAHEELAQKMISLKRQLATRRPQPNAPAQWTYLLTVESIPTSVCFDQDDPKVFVYCGNWRGVRAEACELRVMAIAFGFALKYCASEQPFSPERHQSSSVKILGMECPETHDVAPNE